MRLTSKIEPLKVVELVRLVATDGCYPLEECLQVCREGQHVEATAILCEEMGNYVESIEHYTKHLNQTIVVS